MTAVLLIVLAIGIVIGLPIAATLGLASTAGILWQGVLPISLIAQRIYVGVDSFPLVAVPLFILAGGLMDTGGISVRITNFAQSLVGHFRGGLGMVVVIGSMIFSGISGSHTADTAAIGSVMIPSMIRKGYPPAFATAVVAASGAMGILIPPSILVIFYGLLTGTSISALFLAGLLPGLLMGAVGFATTYFMARHLDLPVEAEFSLCEVWRSLKHSILGLMMPVIILSGVVFGVFTATESAAVAVVYGIVVARFVYRELRWADMVRIVIDSGVTTGIVMIIVGAAATFAWLLTSQQVPLRIATAIASLSSETWVFLLIVNLIFLVLGCFFEVSAIMIMALPILFPIAKTYGIDPVHFGMILVANLGIGMVTPPVGMCLYVACSISGVSIQKATPPLLPLLGTMILTLALITCLPDLTLLLPRWVIGYQSP